MATANLLAIACNWGPYASWNTANRWGLALPANLNLIRVMCLGRVNQALILHAFEYGADGVVLLGCLEEDCRYGPGPDMGRTNVRLVRRLLHLLGIGQERLIELSFGPHQHSALAEALTEFAARVETQGPNPAKPRTAAAGI